MKHPHIHIFHQHSQMFTMQGIELWRSMRKGPLCQEAHTVEEERWQVNRLWSWCCWGNGRSRTDCYDSTERLLNQTESEGIIRGGLSGRRLVRKAPRLGAGWCISSPCGNLLHPCLAPLPTCELLTPNFTVLKPCFPSSPIQAMILKTSPTPQSPPAC